jgi:hypothetical protein
VLVKGDSVISTSATDFNEEVSLIVQFTHPPLAGMMRKGRKAATAELAIATSHIDNDHARFAADVHAIEDRERRKPNNPLKAATSEIRHRYKRVLSGVTLRTRRWMLSGLQQLPYVKRIELDARVTKYDEYSNHVIGADSVWVKCGAQGDGVLIGILDTGIDYTHPDLGGGFGPGFKVIGGIDFVNGDYDPMDDENHGTHVAGIAAADGAGLKGVAPHAKLLAVIDTMAGPGLVYYRLRQIDLDGSVHFSEGCGVNVSTGVDEGVPPTEFALAQNYPNPFNATSTIRYSLPKRSHVTLTFFNALGQQVAPQVNDEQEAGYHEWKFDGSGLASGVYFCRLHAGHFVQTRKLMLLR